MSAGTTRIVVAVVAAWVVIGAVIGIGFLAWSRPGDGFEADWGDEPDAVREWCSDVRFELRSGNPFASFDDVATAALAGGLERPDEPRPTSGAELDAWVGRHRPYLAASYLRQLEGEPHEVALAWAVFDLRLGDARNGRTIADRSQLGEAARSLDRFVRERC